MLLRGAAVVAAGTTVGATARGAAPIDARAAAHLVDPVAAETVRAPRVGDGRTVVLLAGGAEVALANVETASTRVGATWVHRGAFGKGEHLVRREVEGGFEDVVVSERPGVGQLRYRVTVPSGAGLRLVGHTLEIVGAGGAPRARLRRPLAIGADGRSRTGAVSVEGCAYDATGAPPFGRSPVAPGATTCDVVVRFDASGMASPVRLDPTWEAATTMQVQRADHTATSLPDGVVWVVGGALSHGATGGPYHETTEYFDPVSGSWATGPSLSFARARHTATRLPDGRVLVVGGRDGSGPLKASELYDGGTLAVSGALPVARSEHAAVLLPDGRVLVTGKVLVGMQTIGTSDLFDPSCACFTPTAGKMLSARSSHTATLLPDGRVFVAGGSPASDGAADTSELFDPKDADQAWTLGPTLPSPRTGHSAVLQGDVVTLFGGNDTATYDSVSTASPLLGAFVTAQLPEPLPNARATLRADGSMLLVHARRAYLVSASGVVELAPPAAIHRYHTQTLLTDGTVLVAGGTPCPTSAPCAGVAERFLGPSNDDPGFRPNGATCGKGSDCKSGLCARGGVCCDRACDGVCETCGADVAASAGVCHAVPAGTDPSGDCMGAATSGCDVGVTCNGARACECATTRCDGQYVRFPDGTRTDCAPYACRAAACLGGCATSTDCAPGRQCDVEGRCVAAATTAPSSASSAGGGCSVARGSVGAAWGWVALGLLGCAVSGRSRKRRGRLWVAAALTLCSAPSRNAWGAESPWTSVGPSSVARAAAATVALADGRVLVSGGTSATSAAELYDPESRTFSATGALKSARQGHTATRLPDGRVLLVGGGPAESEVYEPTSGTFTKQPCPAVDVVSGHTATLLPDGRVMVVGGSSGTGIFAGSTFVYSPSQTPCPWLPGPPLSTSRARHAAAVFPDGTLVVLGGEGPNGVLASAEFLGAGSDTWMPFQPMSRARSNHAAVVRPDGTLLVAGVDAEFFDPVTNSWKDLGAPAQGVGAPMGVAGDDGTYLLTSGTLAAFVLDPINGWHRASPPRSIHLGGFMAALPGGRFLFGGAVLATTDVEEFRALGSPSRCAEDGDCRLHSCRGGTCCATACAGACMTCRRDEGDGTSSDGACTFIRAGTDPSLECSATVGCAGPSVCDGDGACACSLARCEDDHTLASPTSTLDCAPFRCAKGQCLARCGSNADCVVGAVCTTTGTCAAPQEEQASPSSCTCRTSAGRGHAWVASLAALALVGGGIRTTAKRRAKHIPR